jgi:hypothetical protein
MGVTGEHERANSPCSLRTLNGLNSITQLAKVDHLYFCNWFKCWPPPEIPSQTQKNNILPTLWVPLNLVKSTHKINNHASYKYNQLILFFMTALNPCLQFSSYEDGDFTVCPHVPSFLSECISLSWTTLLHFLHFGSTYDTCTTCSVLLDSPSVLSSSYFPWSTNLSNEFAILKIIFGQFFFSLCVHFSFFSSLLKFSRQ